MAGLEHLDQDLLDQARVFGICLKKIPFAQLCMQADRKMSYMEVKREMEAAASESCLNPELKLCTCGQPG